MQYSDINLDEVRMCSYGEGLGKTRDPGACKNEATNYTEEGYAYCLEHIQNFYDLVNILEGKK